MTQTLLYFTPLVTAATWPGQASATLAGGRPLLGVHNAAEATDEQQTSKQTNIIGFIAVICRESHRRCLKSSLKQR